MIKFLVMDVDGTLTDGKIYIGANGEALKAFDIKDGYGIHDVAMSAGIVPVIITARTSEIVVRRCEELGITEIHQGNKDKMSVLMNVIKKYNSDNAVDLNLANVSYIGDDIIDLKCMELVKNAGGVVGCPNDAVAGVTNMADFVAPHNGGNGAVRDFIEWIVNQ